MYDLAHLLANDAAYVGRALKGAPVIKDYRGAAKAARADLTAALQAGCGGSISSCANDDIGRFSKMIQRPAARA
jgi:hypothetical protein